MENGMHLGIANETYHADRNACSSTWLKLVDKQTPYHLRSYLDSPPATEPSPALVMGSLVDCLIFEPEEFSKQFIIAPEWNLRTKADRAEKQLLLGKCKRRGKTLVTHKQNAEALETAKAVRMNPVMADILKRGVAQPTFLWTDPITGMQCKCKLDWYDEEDGVIYDLKTAADASSAAFSKAIANFGYHIQAAFYSDGVRACGFPVRKFVFGVMEKPDGRNTHVADPRLMAFYELEQEDEDAGRDSYNSSIAAISFCKMNDEWAGYTNRIVPITRPAWAKRTDIETDEL